MKDFNVTGLILIVSLFFSGVSCSDNQTKKSYYDNGVDYAVQGELQKAKKEFEKSLKVDSFFSPAKLSLQTIRDVIEQKLKRETAIHLFKGVSYYNKGQYDQAISVYTKIIELNQNYADAYNNRGVAFVDKGEYDLAISDHTTAIEINPRDADSYYNNRGNAYERKGQYDLAISDYTTAIEINPKHADVYYNRGTVFDDKGEYDLAISDYTTAIEINPRDADAYNNRGLTYFEKLGNKVKGCADFKKACELGMCDNYNILKIRGDCQ